MRSRTARVMTTLMRNGRDRRSENPSGPTRYLSACCCPGPISGSHQGQQPLRLHRNRGNPPSENRPYTWLHPNASQKVRFALAPRAPSIHGGKQKLGQISKQGDRYLRRILVVGAHAVLKLVRQKPEKYPWLTQLLARKPFKVVAIALANKMARIAWALLVKGGPYRARALVAAA